MTRVEFPYIIFFEVCDCLFNPFICVFEMESADNRADGFFEQLFCILTDAADACVGTSGYDTDAVFILEDKG